MLARAPNPVETPYTGSAWWTSRSTTAAPRSMAARASVAELDTAPVAGDGDDVAGGDPVGTEHERAVVHGAERSGRCTAVMRLSGA